MKNRYMPTALSLYVNYFVHGMGALILAQSMDFLSNQMNTDAAGVAFVISGMGIGRLIVLFVLGALSDKFGRKPFVFLGMVIYAFFFVAILFSPNTTIGFILAVLAGIANSSLDAGTYPALMESFPKHQGIANIFTKASISFGQFVLPMIMAFVVANNMYFGWGFIICAAVLAINALVLIKMVFPDHKAIAAADADKAANAVNQDAPSVFREKPKMAVEGVCLILIGYTSTATFFLFSIWMPKFATNVAGMAGPEALRLISLYAIGSLCSIGLTTVFLRKFPRPAYFVLIYPIISTIFLFLLYLNPGPAICYVCSFVVGYAGAGGVLQLALTAMAEFFPEGKGKITGIVYTCSSVATFSIPVITGIIARTTGIRDIMLFNAGVTFVGVVLAAVVVYRYRKVMNLEAVAA